MSDYPYGTPVPPTDVETPAQNAQASAYSSAQQPASSAAAASAAQDQARQAEEQAKQAKEEAKRAKRQAKQEARDEAKRAKQARKASKAASSQSQPKAGGTGGFAKGLLGGVVGAAIVAAAFVGLWAGTDVFDSLKGTSTSTSSSSGTITIENSEDATVAEAVAAKCIDSVVTIYVYSESSDWTYYFGTDDSSGDSSEADALGSGVIIKSEDGYSYILTNYHVVEDITRAVVKVGDEQYEAEAVGSDSKTDLAVIRIAVDGLTPLEWGDSDSVTVGEWVMAIGSPYGYENTVTTGIVSALYRSDVLSDSTTLSTTVYTDMIQTDAAINPGNSGGALVNAEGQLIGINTYISSTSESSAGLGFAIPSSTAQEVAEQLMSGETVDHAFLGITMQDASDGSGVEVTAVYANTAAAEAGLQTGDIITAIDGEEITTSTEVSVAVTAKSSGDTMEITFLRDGEEQTVTATLGTDASDTSEYAEGGEPATESDSGNGYYDDSSSGDEYYYDNGGYYDYGLGDMLDELFGGSSDSGDDSDSSGGSFWE